MCNKHRAINRLRAIMRTAKRGDDKSVLTASTNLLRELPVLESEGVRLGAAEYNAVLEFMIKVNRLQMARWVVGEMEKRILSNPFTHVLNLELLAKMKDTKALQRHLSMMEAERVRPSSSSYQALLDVASPDGVVKVLDTMRKQKITISITHYNTALRRGRLNRAGEVLKMMKEDKLTPDVKSFNALMHACADDAPQAEKVFALMVARSITPSASSYGTLSAVYKNAKDYPNALRIFAKMQAANHPAEPRDFGTLIKAVTLDPTIPDKVATAEALFNRAEQLGATSQLLYVKMMEVYQIHCDRKGAESLMKRMAAEGLRPLPAFTSEYNKLLAKAPLVG
eukprot:TRINITY_DN24654_c0_g1_i1.p1 TRINITY_DN24654_c0_g1~~TRINITY_DN24654_c0_g1_i1.p1  ORF type:complete len:361 (+),score=60.55 TRINITY_DN24654_c0_g1_i1:68-1084(+)